MQRFFKCEIKTASRWQQFTVNKWIIVIEPNHLNGWFIYSVSCCSETQNSLDEFSLSLSLSLTLSHSLSLFTGITWIVNPLILQGMSTSAILTWGSLSYTRVFTSFSPTQFSFSHPAPCCLKSKCICPHLCTQVCWSKKEVCSGALLACYYFEELKIACTIDQLKPSLKSMAQYYNTFLLFRERVSRKCTSGWDHTMHVHFAYYTQGCAEAHKYAKNLRITV